MEKKLAREDAWALLTEYTKTPALQKHALMVEAVMEHFGRLAGEDEEVWGVAGLLHDLDYEMYPEEHCKKAEEIMRERGIDETYIRAMSCHGSVHPDKTGKPDGKNPVCYRRINRADSCGLHYAPVKERAGSGSEIR